MRLRRVASALAGVWTVWVMVQPMTEACTVCFGKASGPMIDGARMGVWLLFGLTVVVQLAFIAFFICLYRRGKAAAGPDTIKTRFRLVKGEE